MKTRLDSLLEDLLTRRDALDARINALKLARDTLRADYDEDQPRDESGRWTDGGGGGGGGKAKAPSGGLASIANTLATGREFGFGGGPGTPKGKATPIDGSLHNNHVNTATTGLKKIAESLGKHYTSTDKPGDVLVARASRLSPDEHRYLMDHADGRGIPDAKVEASIKSKLGTDKSTAEIADVYKASGTFKAVHDSRAKWQGEASGHVDTQTAFKQGGKYRADRQAIHDKYYEDSTKGVPTTKEPTMYLTGGGPASGKTTGLLNNKLAAIPDKATAAHINADEAKEYLPEYKAGKAAKDMYAASFVHEESSETAKNAVNKALGNGHDVVFDSTGDGGVDSLDKKINGYTDKDGKHVPGYRDMGAKKIVANYATIDVNEAVRRSDERAEKSGRFVPHTYLRENHAAVAATLKGAIERKLFDKLDVWDTSRDKLPPIHVASFTKEGGLVVHDKARWDKAMARADGTP